MSRDMYWLRIDRYYSSTKKVEVAEGLQEGMAVPGLYGSKVLGIEGALENPAENPM